MPNSIMDEHTFTILGTPESSLNNLKKESYRADNSSTSSAFNPNRRKIKIANSDCIFDSRSTMAAHTVAGDCNAVIDDGIAPANSNSPISDFYHNSTVLITGGTGFLGKVLIHKLLTTFVLKRIYVLIRTKDNLNIEERLQNLFNESIFDNIRKNQGHLLTLVHPIRADYNADEMFSNVDRKMLIDNVEIVFNLVASVRFNEKLHDAIAINLLGTAKVLNFVEQITSLKSFVHISTLYCNCNRKFIGEEVYASNIDLNAIMKLNELLDADTMEKIKHCILGQLPNTYTVTKKLAEILVKSRAAGRLAAGIFRPPIVMSIYKDPIPGWTDNVYGPSGICLWIARGVLRCALGHSDERMNMVPADYCINALISSAWDISRRYIAMTRKKRSEAIPVYNYVFKSNNITWKQYISLAQSGFHEPFDKQMWCFSFVFLRWKWLYKIVDFFLHVIPGYIFDLIAIAQGRQRKFSKDYKKREKILYSMSWFCLQHWDYSNDNIVELYRKMTAKDRCLLEWHWDSIDWREYFHNYLSGIRKYYLKEKNDKLEQKKALMIFYKIIHFILKSTCRLSALMILSKVLAKLFRFQLTI